MNGALISKQDAKAGLELTDHEGGVYRASNDPDVLVTVEETGPVRTTIRATGWYVKDGTSGERLSPFLPTDRLCKHDTRITAYAGKPHVTVQHALIVTFDTHKVRLRHIGVTQRMEGASAGEFGLDGKAIASPDPGLQSVRLYQPASVDGQIELGDPSQPDFRVIEKGKRGDGWVRFGGAKGYLTLCITDFWQLYPKELELLADRISLNIWPRYGRTYAGINPLDLGELGNHWLNMAPFVDRYLPFTGNENYRKRVLAWALDDSPYDSPRANTQALKYYETGDVSHLKECLPDVFFLSLRYSTVPPRITEQSGMYGWLKTVFRATHWPVYLRALADAGIPLFVESRQNQPIPANGRVAEKTEGGKFRSVCIIQPGTSAVFLDKQIVFPDRTKSENA